MTTSVNFYCDRCSLDQVLEPYQETLSTGEEYFWAKCQGCRRKVVRYITEIKNDPYFKKSFNLKVQRNELKKDLIQPGDPEFQMYYKAEYDKIMKAEEERARKEKAKQQEKVDFYKKYAHNINERQLAKKVLEVEEKYDAR